MFNLHMYNTHFYMKIIFIPRYITLTQEITPKILQYYDTGSKAGIFSVILAMEIIVFVYIIKIQLYHIVFHCQYNAKYFGFPSVF